MKTKIKTKLAFHEAILKVFKEMFDKLDSKGEKEVQNDKEKAIRSDYVPIEVQN